MTDAPKPYPPMKSSTLWPATSGDGRGRLYTVEASAEMDSGRVVSFDAARWERMEALLAEVDADDWTDVEGELIAFPTEADMAALMEGETLEEMLAAAPGGGPFEMDADFLAWDRVPGPAMDDDDEWEIEFETSEPGDMATIARAYLNMTPEERADFDRDLPDARSDLRAFIDSLDDDSEPLWRAARAMQRERDGD